MEFISYTQWNTMTTQQKREKDYVIVGDENGKYSLINGKDYVELGEYIPYSTKANIISDAHVKNFVKEDPLNRWGYGSSPVTFASLDNTPKSWYGYNQEEDAIYLGVNASGQTSRFRTFVNYNNHEIAPNSFTVYLVAKVLPPLPSMATPFAACYGVSVGNYLYVYIQSSTKLYIKDNASTAALITDKFNINNYVIYCIQYDGTTKISNACAVSPDFELTEMFYTTAGTTVLGPNLGFGSGGYIQQSSTSSFATLIVDMYVKYIGVVNTYESVEIVHNNIASLQQKFLVVE